MMKQRQKNKRYNATNYKRLDKEKESDEGSGEETELYVKKIHKKKEIPTVEKELEENDTLQSLAIRYHCTVSDLKRLNNIDKDNEIFARRTIKVPYRPFSMALVHQSGRTSPNNVNNEVPTSNLIDIDSLSSKLHENGTKNEVNEIIFQSQIQQIENEENQRDNLPEDEEIHLLPSRDTHTDPVVSSLTSCSGADADISWIGLIVFIVLLIFAGPLIYVFWIAEHIDNYKHHNS